MIYFICQTTSRQKRNFRNILLTAKRLKAPCKIILEPAYSSIHYMKLTTSAAKINTFDDTMQSVILPPPLCDRMHRLLRMILPNLLKTITTSWPLSYLDHFLRPQQLPWPHVSTFHSYKLSLAPGWRRGIAHVRFWFHTREMQHLSKCSASKQILLTIHIALNLYRSVMIAFSVSMSMPVLLFSLPSWSTVIDHGSSARSKLILAQNVVKNYSRSCDLISIDFRRPAVFNSCDRWTTCVGEIIISNNTAKAPMSFNLGNLLLTTRAGGAFPISCTTLPQTFPTVTLLQNDSPVQVSSAVKKNPSSCSVS